MIDDEYYCRFKRKVVNKCNFFTNFNRIKNTNGFAH